MKKAVAGILSLILMFSLTACSANKLADSFSEDEVISKAKEVIELLNQQDYDSAVTMFSENLKAQLSSEQLKTALDSSINQAGEFREYSSAATAGQKDKNTDEDIAVSVITCKYENSNHTYTISFNQELEVIGLYMK